MREDSLIISVDVRIHNTTYGIVNLEDKTDVILSGVIIHDTNPFQSTFHYNNLMVKERKSGNTKTPSLPRRNRMLRALNLRQDVVLLGSTKLEPSLLPLDELIMGKDHLSTDSGYDNHSCINFPFHRALNQVDSNTDLLDEVILIEVVLRPTRKPRNVGPHK